MKEKVITNVVLFFHVLRRINHVIYYTSKIRSNTFEKISLLIVFLAKPLDSRGRMHSGAFYRRRSIIDIPSVIPCRRYHLEPESLQRQRDRFSVQQIKVAEGCTVDYVRIKSPKKRNHGRMKRGFGSEKFATLRVSGVVSSPILTFRPIRFIEDSKRLQGRENQFLAGIAKLKVRVLADFVRMPSSVETHA